MKDLQTDGHQHTTGQKLACGLGLFSLALGLLEVVMPKRLAKMLGLEEDESLIQAFGLREIASGIGILASSDPKPWIGARIAGDALDIGTLTRGLTRQKRASGNAFLALVNVAVVTALDIYCAQRLSNEQASSQHAALPAGRDYSDRVGLPRPPDEMRGAARDFHVPDDMLPPPQLRELHPSF